MKFSVTLTLLFVTFLATAVNCQSHNVTWGVRGPFDYKIHNGFASKSYSLLRIVSSDYYFNQTHYLRNITEIKVTDLYTNGNGGYAKLMSGGPRSSHAKIHFESQRNHGFAFQIEIYGH